MKTTTRIGQAFFACLLVLGAGHAAAQPAYPGKLVRMIIPYPAGGGVGLAGHLLAEKVGELMKADMTRYAQIIKKANIKVEP